MERDGTATVDRDQRNPSEAVEDVGEGREDGGGRVGEVDVVRVESEDGNCCPGCHQGVSSPVVPVQPQHGLASPARGHAHQPAGLQEANTLSPGGGGAEHELSQGLEAGDQEEMSVDHTVDQAASGEVEPGHGVDVVSRDGPVVVDQQGSSSLAQAGQARPGYFPLVENVSPAQH